MKITIEMNDDAQTYTVRIDDRFADHLCIDEVLGCVASALFRSDRRPMFVRTYEELAAWQQRFGEGIQKPAGLLIHTGATQ